MPRFVVRYDCSSYTGRAINESSIGRPQYRTVEVIADTQEEAIAMADHQNGVLTVQNASCPFRLTSVVCLDPPPKRHRWWHSR